MTIPTLAEVTEKVSNQEIAGIEALLTKRLESAGTVAFLNDPKVVDKTLKFNFEGVHLTETAIALLIASITKAKWTNATVVNTQGPAYNGIGHQPRPRDNPVLVVSFKAPAAPGVGE